MSFTNVIAGPVAAANYLFTAEEAIYAVNFIPVRELGPFTVYTTFEEKYTDELVITDNPVEQGAQISDHAYKKPASLSMQIGWSNSDPEAGFDPNYVANVYNQLLFLQASRVPFTVETPWRRYPSQMLIQSISVVRDQKTRAALHVNLDLRQVILVETQAYNEVGDPANMAFPQDTAPPAEAGVKQPQPVSSQVLVQ